MGWWDFKPLVPGRESMTAMSGIPEIAVRPAGCVDGFYVWHALSARYEWLEVPPTHTTP